MKISPSVIVASTILLMPALFISVIFLLPDATVQDEQIQTFQFIEKDTDDLVVQTHELPKYRPPQHWTMIFQAPAGADELPGLVDGIIIVYARRLGDGAGPATIDQVAERLHTFSTFEEAQSFYESRINALVQEPYDVVFNEIGHRTNCREFYDRGSDADTTTMTCLYGNLVIEVKAQSKILESKSHALATLEATESKF